MSNNNRRSVTTASNEENKFLIQVLKGLKFVINFQTEIESRNYRSLIVDLDRKVLEGANNSFSEYSRAAEISLADFWSELTAACIPPPRPEIKAGDYPVEFLPGGIQVGCTFVPTATVDLIHTELHKS